MSLKQTLRALTTVVLDEVERNPEFAERLEQALGGTKLASSSRKSRSRDRALVDPIAVLAEQGEEELRGQLKSLSVEQLLDVVAEFGMDSAKLVMKWKSPDRITEHIVEGARRRSVKGDAFRA